VHVLTDSPLLPAMVQQPSAFVVGHEPTTLPPLCEHWFAKLLVSAAPETPEQASACPLVTSQ
jgi:hypothetical protein